MDSKNYSKYHLFVVSLPLGFIYPSFAYSITTIGFFYPSSIYSICLINIKELSRFSDTYSAMNLHEECLLKYLLNPLDIFRTTELLKLNNALIEKETLELVAKKGQINYTANRV